MAGGKGSRLKMGVEKPLLNFNGKPLIDYTIENLEKSRVDCIILALSPNTPKTLEYMENKGVGEFNSFNSSVSYLMTSGVDYLKDYNFILNFLESFSKDNTVVFINADLPFISYGVIDDVLSVYSDSSLDALSVFLPESVFVDLGLDFEYSFEGKVPVGLNIVRSENIIQSQKDLVLHIPSLAFNINTESNLHVALKYLEENDDLNL